MRPAGRALRGIVPALAPLFVVLALTGCNSLFFQPNRIGYTFPEQFGLAYEDVYFESPDGLRLNGWFLPAEGPARGTVVFFHGNGANISNHLPVVRWLPPAGYAVLLFDYRGYGISEGEPTREGVVQDGMAAIAYARDRPDVDAGRLVILGQSLGGPVAISALARAGTEGVRALVLEGAFVSYREAARTFMNGIWLTWPLQYPIAYLFIRDDHSAYDDLPAVADVPLLMLHSRADTTVPLVNGRRLYEAFPGPDKTFWELEDVRHIGAFIPPGSPWRWRLLRWLAERLPPPPAGE